MPDGNTTCCVCHADAAPSVTGVLGGRFFCATHLERAKQALRLHWSRAGFIELGLTLAYVACVGFVFGNQGLPGGWLKAALVLPPVAIWLIFVYRLDRLEPEPPMAALVVGTLAALLAAACTQPLLQLLAVETWKYRSATATVVAAVAIEGLIAQLCIYAAVRYSVFMSDEFDEPMDGLFYSTAAAVGVATAENLHVVAHSDSIRPLAGAVVVTVTVLVHVAASVPLGIALGRLRFGRSGNLLAGLALGVSALVHGLFHELTMHVGGAATGFDPKSALMTVVTLVVVVLVVGHVVSTRLVAAAIDHLSLKRHRRWGEWPVWLVAVVLLGSAAAYAASMAPRAGEVQVLDAKLAVHVPAGWVSTTSEQGLVVQRSALGEAVTELRIDWHTDAGDTEVALLQLEERLRARGTGFRVRRAETRPALGDASGQWSWFAMVQDTGGAFPAVVTGVLIAAAGPDQRQYKLSVTGPRDTLTDAAIADLVAGVRVLP